MLVLSSSFMEYYIGVRMLSAKAGLNSSTVAFCGRASLMLGLVAKDRIH